MLGDFGTCAECNKQIAYSNSAFSQAGHAPQPGEVVVCTSCGAIGVLNDELKFRSITPRELEYLRVSSPLRYTMICKFRDGLRGMRQGYTPGPNQCGKCGIRFDGLMYVAGRGSVPSDYQFKTGDMMVCPNCHDITIADKECKLRSVTPAELDLLELVLPDMVSVIRQQIEIGKTGISCPGCKKTLMAMRTMSGAPSRPGQVSLCECCGFVSILNEHNLPVAITDEQMQELKAKHPEGWAFLMDQQKKIRMRA